jgi:hypothetical protein
VAKDAGGDLFRSAQQQKNQYQGIWILSPEGKVLAAHQDYRKPETWTSEVLAATDAALAAFGPVPARQTRAANPLPNRGIGVQPDGSVSLALYTRYTAGGGQQYAPAAVESGSRWLWDGEFRTDGPPVIDTLTLTRAEWSSFTPPRLTAGTEWSIAAAIARKFARALSPSSDQSGMPRPEEATIAELREKVKSLDGSEAQIRFTGRWETDHVYDGKHSLAWASAEGIAGFDRRRKALRSLLMVFSGAYRMAPPWDKETRPTGAVVEWSAERPAR